MVLDVGSGGGMSKRRIVQIVSEPDSETAKGCLWAVADDGSLWWWAAGQWTEFQGLPDVAPSSSEGRIREIAADARAKGERLVNDHAGRSGNFARLSRAHGEDLLSIAQALEGLDDAVSRIQSRLKVAG